MEVQNHKKPTKPCKCKVHMPDGIWTYLVGKRFLTIKSPDLMRTYRMSFTEYTGDPEMDKKMSLWNDRGHCYAETEGWAPPLNILPSDVRKWIENLN